MYHELLEDIAQNNRLIHINPVIKLILGIGCIIISVSSQSFVTPLFIALTLSTAIVIIAGIDLKLYLKLLLIPLGFALLSVLVIIFIRNSGEVILNIQPISWLTLNVTTGSLNEGFLILSRVFGGTCSLYFISLTTPATELFSLGRRCRIPDFLIDLSMLIYRFIFVFIEQAYQIKNAQLMRLGYSRRNEAINSFGMMAGALFINTWESGENLVRAMECRCYDGKFATLNDPDVFSVKAFILVLIYLSATVIIMNITSETTLFGSLPL